MANFFAGTISHSIAVTADAFNNLSDAGSSAVTLIGFKLAGAKPDSEHPFGHGRIEYVSGLIVAAAILLMAYELIRILLIRSFNPEESEFSVMVVVILIISILVKLYMYLYNSGVAKKIDSAAMKATATDSLSDTCATAVYLWQLDRTFYRNLCGWLLWCISWCIYHVCGHRSCERYLKSAFRATAGGGICAEDRSDRNGT